MALQWWTAILFAFGVVAVQEHTFSEIEGSSDPAVVLFFHSSRESASGARDLLEEAEAKVKDMYPQMRFKVCDGDAEANKNKFASAQFTEDMYLFTQTPESGIRMFAVPCSLEKYTHSMDAETVASHVKYMMMSPSSNEVISFENEDDFFDLMDRPDPPRPLFVKFFEQWCTHCKAAKKPFQIAASEWKDRIGFVEVECSKTSDTKAFCQKHDVTGYPVLKLFMPEEQVKFTASSRTVLAFNEFLSSFPLPQTSEPVAAPVKDEL